MISFFQRCRLSTLALTLTLAAAILTLSAPLQAQQDQSHNPANAIDSFDIHPDLQVELFAAEPQVMSISAMDVDSQGRVWVAEVVNYRHFANENNPVREEGDRILVLEDTDHDGTADRSTVFYQGRDIDSPHGIAVLDDRVIVSASGNVFAFRDTDGDLKADSKEVMFSGISGEQHDHGIHAFLFGPDGKLYFNFGNEGKQLMNADGSPVVDLAGNTVNNSRNPYQEGMVFRTDLDGSNVETLGWNFRNNWEVTIDSFGTLWQSDNDDDGNRAVRINYVMEYGNYGFKDEITGAGWRTPRTGWNSEIPLRHFHLNDPGVVPNLLQTGAGAPTGITLYEGNLLPEVFQNEMIHTDAGPNIVRAYPVARDGAGYSAQVINLVKGVRDQWFRPSDVVVAPDGSLFVADWYDPGVGGHRMGDTTRGRVFRITPKGHTGYNTPAYDYTTPQGAAQALTNPSFTVREKAWRALHEMGTDAEPALLELFNGRDQRIRARALWLLAKIPGRDSAYVERAIVDAYPDIRIVGIRLARQLGHDLIPIVQRLIEDPRPHVRRELAIALRHNQSPQAPQLWAKLAQKYDGQDRWYLEALGISADSQWDTFLPAFLTAINNELDSNAARNIIWRSRATQTPNLLAKLITDPATSEANRLRYFRAFDFQSDSAADPALKQLLAGSSPQQGQITALALSHLSQLDTSDPAVRAAADRALTATAGTDQFIDLVARFNLTDRSADLLAIASNPAADANLRVSAAKLLGQFNQQQLLRSVALGNDNTRALTVLQTVGLSADNAILGILTEVANNEQAPTDRRQAAVQAFGQSRSAEWWLLGTVRGDNLAQQLKPAAALVLSASGDPNIRTEAAQHVTMPASVNNQPLPPLSDLVQRSGNAANGKTVYSRSCIACHKIGTSGVDFGPALTEIGDKLAKQELYTSIIQPSAAIGFGYEGFLVETNSGNQYLGYIASETDTNITLRMQGGLLQRINKSDLKSRTPLTESLMLPNLQATMTEQELVDLVEYLTTLRK